MFRNVLHGLTLVLSVVGVVGLTGAADPGVVGLAAVVALAILALAVAVAASPATLAAMAGAHPLRARDRSAPLTQSDPDAAGHARPRAPGVILPAAA